MTDSASSTPAPFVIGFFEHMNPNGMTGATWRHPDNRGSDYLDLEYWMSLARRLDEAHADFLFFADSYGSPAVDGVVPDTAIRMGDHIPAADPFAVVPAIFAVTKHLPVVVTASTIFEEPYANARRFATLDHISKGRIGWNVVTSAGAQAAADSFGRDLVPHDERYDRADDYLALSYRLFEGSWEADAVPKDRVSGTYADPAKVHSVRYDGPFFRSKGVFSVEPSPQRVPFVFQAGSSGRGREFAATHAECVFLQGTTVEGDAASVADIRERADAAGRDGSAIQILVGLTVIIGDTPDEARAKYEEFASFHSEEIAASQFSHYSGVDLLALDPDQPIPAGNDELSQSNVRRFDGWTVREILNELKTRGVRGMILVGTAAEVADRMEQYANDTGVDGFLMETYTNPGTYDEILDQLLPELRTRGRAPLPFTTSTLRERFQGHGKRLVSDSHPASAHRVGRI
ncbi:FMN-dependent oxidoreductase (nitrilotriacetate monooxygenase family) [Frondihabitans sp. PhB188]|uniref:NtaA/DmoA family FMN-dependent monooxygenase n=1 Tax=Frondihabitans sp. PhB188 TaxID=2485200 RepID=UPI000F471F6C|nr:NtaA/DmoA family FMN-dependent monooxygenase [Frondihabitans sp. PhB188]ROQ40723.1 FMN-dependent oxidoreductase (nitrilotriacetate monooxygenase family) [Frondihabitans sp. PhB188]